MIGHVKKLSVIIGSVIVLLIVVVIITQNLKAKSSTSKFVSESPLGIYKNAAVATNGPECSQIGSNILRRNGSAVDAAIAALLCEGVASLHSMGLGGGFLMTIYNATSNTSYFLDARETAPALANETMYGGNANLSLYGGLSIAVPGELLGYWEAHQRFGKLPWKDLFDGAIELCETGVTVTKYLEDSLKGKEAFIRAKENNLEEILINPETNQVYSVGEKIRRPRLKETLRRLANSSDPAYLFYKGAIRDSLVQEIQDAGGIISLEDFSNYRVNWTAPLEARVGNKTLYTAPPPGSGALLVFMLNVLEGLLPVSNENVMWQRIVETFKWAYAKRTELGDPRFVDVDNLLKNLTSQDYADAIRLKIKDNKTYTDPEFYGAVTTNKEDHGTAHVSVLAPDGSAVSVTSTINQVLGSKLRSKSTGIIFNDEMDDFSSPNITNGFDLPPSPNNYILPNKRPLSSMTPTIVVDENNQVQLVVGAAGGSKITTAVASIVLLHLFDNYNIKEAIDAYRIHHQLFPMQVQNEKNFPSSVLKYLTDIGHNTTTFSGIGSAVTGVSKTSDRITANSDYRRQGTTSGY